MSKISLLLYPTQNQRRELENVFYPESPYSSSQSDWTLNKDAMNWALFPEEKTGYLYLDKIGLIQFVSPEIIHKHHLIAHLNLCFENNQWTVTSELIPETQQPIQTPENTVLSPKEQIKEKRRLKLLNKYINISENSYQNQQYSVALSTLKKAMTYEPNPHKLYEVFNNIGVINMVIGELEESLYYLDLSIFFKPNYWTAHLNRFFCLVCSPKFTPESLFEKFASWITTSSNNSTTSYSFQNIDTQQTNKIKIGYLSSGFNQGANQYIINVLLSHHDKHSFDIYCYSDVQNPDKVTEQFQQLANEWRNIVNLNNEQVSQLVYQDGIHILIDFDGITSPRLMIYNMSPAPIQASFFPLTSGLKSMNYRIVDPLITPPTTTQFNTEKLKYLKQSLYCFTPENNQFPEIEPLNRNKREIVFGSFNQLLKLNAHVIDVWSQILLAIPNSRLILKNKAFSDLNIQEKYLHLFESFGVASQQINFQGWVSNQEHLALYNQIDIALDTFPFNGHITTLEALWMGVPVITYSNDLLLHDLSRAGKSILSHIDCNELIGNNTSQYCQIAIDLAQNIDKRIAYKTSLRKKIKSSCLADGLAYTQDIESIYRQIWNEWQLT